MQRLLPVGPPGDENGEIPLDPAVVDELIAAEDRPGTTARPWVVTNMVTSADGATAVDGVSGPLGGDGDRAVFLALRAVADVVLAGSGTVRAERYRPAMGDAARRRRRTDRGQAPLPRLAVISNQGDVDLSLPLFADADPARPPIVLTSAHLTAARRRPLEQVAEVIVAGDERVDPNRAVALLGEVAGAEIVLCEGGATLNGLLLAADLIDEWCLTIGPRLVGGDARRAAVGAMPAAPRDLRLARVLHHDGELLLRYVRDRGRATPAAP